jgi:hypothetical protein
MNTVAAVAAAAVVGAGRCVAVHDSSCTGRLLLLLMLLLRLLVLLGVLLSVRAASRTACSDRTQHNEP